MLRKDTPVVVLYKRNPDQYRKGTVLGNRKVQDGMVYSVGVGEPHYFNYEVREFHESDVQRFEPLSDEAAQAKHDAELPLAFDMVQKALAELIPGEKAELQDGSISAYGGAVTLDPVVYETKRIGVVQETAGWQVTTWKEYPGGYWTPPEYVDAPVGEPTQYGQAVQRFVETVFKIKADGYWDALGR